MPNKLKEIIISRLLVIAEILAVIASGIVADIIPQRFQSSADQISQWRTLHSGLIPLADLLQLHSVYTSFWFVLVIALAGISLAVSSVDQIRLARNRIKVVVTSGQELATINEIKPEQLRRIAAAGYRPQPVGQDRALKFIRCSWGYWGTALFHIGMVVVIATSLVIALTERRGALMIAQGETLAPTDEWTNTEEGLLAGKLRLPATFRFDDLRITYDSRNIPEHIESLVTFIRSGSQEQLSVAVNAVARYQGMRIYHANEYGDAFSLEFIAPDGSRHLEKLLIEHPTGLKEAGYLDTKLPWLPFTLSLKYFADFEHKSMNSPNRQLIMRLMTEKQERARATLIANQSARLGDYQVRLLRVDKWAKFTFVDVHGMAAVFAGFALMMLGALLSYMTPPRELFIVPQEDNRYSAYWRSTKFAEFYAEERAALVSILESAA
ncbi:cytochrome c biogenesis protein Ccs1 [Geobacter sp. OR-1]|uniref:cytochrome c biogenesis protein ResB n=1 Tax=Geobacter sp. OR-1 TaxID=1266765 RepID=UPI0005419D5F|nr:cytochrome c biogenesis protein ResB [Geobacter sp. OR-1]GAM09106.1 cytochrome c biogenesis protein Ccs1 [Geobacter sp. OR-1]